MTDDKKILEIMEISDPKVVHVLFHEQKQQILKLLIENELNLKEIRDLTKINPGTVKRHLEGLLEFNLIYQSKTEVNNYSITMKFYKARAKNYLVNLKWP